jgi:FAD/FMN-containing dehydrogenase
MHRRRFCKSAVAVAIASSLSACGARQQAGDPGPFVSAVSLDGEELSIESVAIEELAAGLEGRLFLQGDEGYDSVKRVWNGMFDHKMPAMVVQCGSVDDVCNAVKFAGERKLLVSVRGGGHSFPGKSTSDGGMMIDLSQMHSVDVDAEAMTMRADGGCLLGHIDDAATAHNLMTTTGIVSHTGAGGFTLGGGLGRTDRKMGLAVDNLLAATVVTPSGDAVSVSNEENADLFWGIRGGGGNFGIATEFVYRLHPFNPMVYGGNLHFDASKDTLEFLAELLGSAADEANIEFYLAAGPDEKPEITAEVVWCGDHAAGAEALASLTGFSGLKRGELTPFPYRQIQTSVDAILGHGLQYYLKSSFITELTPEALETIIDFSYRGGPAGWWTQHMGGASARVAPDATAYSHRNVAINFGIMYVSPDPSGNEAGIAAVREFYEAMQPHFVGFYTNLNDDSEQKTWGNYGENYPRLVELKNKYDPLNLFRLNANVRPTA